jgi:hypothetical protein
MINNVVQKEINRDYTKIHKYCVFAVFLCIAKKCFISGVDYNVGFMRKNQIVEIFRPCFVYGMKQVYMRELGHKSTAKKLVFAWFLGIIGLSAEIEKHPPTCTYKHNAQFRPKKQRLARVSSF